MKAHANNRIIVNPERKHRAIDIVDGPDQAPASIARHESEYGPGLIDISWDEYFAAERAVYMTGPSAVTKEDYHEALNCLPPDNWERADSVERFTMCERLTGTLTACYAQQDDNYLHKTVDLSDRSTWITSADFVSVFGERAA